MVNLGRADSAAPCHSLHDTDGGNLNLDQPSALVRKLSMIFGGKTFKTECGCVWRRFSSSFSRAGDRYR